MFFGLFDWLITIYQFGLSKDFNQKIFADTPNDLIDSHDLFKITSSILVTIYLDDNLRCYFKSST